MSERGTIQGLGSRDSVIHAVADAGQRGLTPDESMLVSRVGAGATVAQVLQGCPLPEARAIALLLGLRLKGIIGPGPRKGSVFSAAAARGASASRSPPTPPRPRAAPVSAPDPKAMAETVDLTDDQKRDLLATEARVSGGDPFLALGIPPGSNAAEAKRAYYELTRRYHPDRFFGKKLGSFKGRIDTIFKRITEAQQTLTDPAKRAAWVAAHPHVEEDLPSALIVEPVDEERATERRARMARHPYLAKHARVHELLVRGREALAKGEHSKAYNDLNLAAQMDQSNKEVQALLLQARKAGERARAEGELAEATRLETLGDREAALSHYRTAASLDPENLATAHRLATLLVARGGETDLKEAMPLARRASESAPTNADYRLTYAGLLLAAGFEKNARREYEAVLKLRPDDERARAQVKKLKWKLG